MRRQALTYIAGGMQNGTTTIEEILIIPSN